MKLGNYKWMVCPKCGKRYVRVLGGKQHKCSTSIFGNFFKRHKKAKTDKAEQHFNDIMNAGEDDKGNPIF